MYIFITWRATTCFGPC